MVAAWVAVAIAFLVMTCSGVNSHGQSSCNQFDQPHNFECSAGSSIHSVTGNHKNYHEDRIYCYSCYTHTGCNKNSQCYRTGYVNGWDAPVMTLCKPNYYIAGVKSYHDNSKEDRRFDFKCCRSTGLYISDCTLDGPINSFDGTMNYHLSSSQVIVGAFSWHINYHE